MKIIYFILLFLFSGQLFGRTCNSIINSRLFKVAAQRIGAEKTKNLPRLVMAQREWDQLVYIKQLIKEIGIKKPGPLREELYVKLKSKKNKRQVDQILKIFLNKKIFCNLNKDKKSYSILTPEELEDLLARVKL